jgi:selenocysteine-specific elongation factor
MREVVLGTAGHVDHGKTTLVQALTGINTDRLQEEQKRGITIELGFAYLDLPCGHRLGIIDVPGHEKFVRNMVAGATGIDLVALIVAADEGIMPQTREHFEICQLLGVQRGCIVITKKDLVEPDWLGLVIEESREFVAGSFLEDAPIVVVSAVTGEGMEDLVKVIDQLVQSCDFSETHGPFRLPVDRVFSMKGFGAVVTGTSISGRISVGDSFTLYPSGRSGRIRGIQVHGEDRPLVEAGYRTAINVQGVDKEDIGRGEVLATPGILAPTYIIDADFFYLSSNSKKLKNRARVRVHLGTAEIMARILLLEREELAPGERTIVQLLLEQPAGIWPEDRYVVRSYSPVRTIGGGSCLNNASVKRQRLKGLHEALFAAWRRGSPEEKIQAHLEEGGPGGLTFDDLAIKLGIFGNRLKKLLAKPISEKKILIVESDRQRMIAERTCGKLMELLLEKLAGYHKENPLKSGLGKEELKNLMGRRVDQRLLHFLLNEQVKAGSVVVEEASVRLSSHKVSFQEEEEELRKNLVAIFRESLLAPPRINELAGTFSQTPRKKLLAMLEVLAREELITRVGEDLYFDSSVLSDLAGRLKKHLQRHGDIDAQGFKQMTGATRKFSIPLMEYFDRQKLTLRVGDKRVLRANTAESG